MLCALRWMVAAPDMAGIQGPVARLRARLGLPPWGMPADARSWRVAKQLTLYSWRLISADPGEPCPPRAPPAVVRPSTALAPAVVRARATRQAPKRGGARGCLDAVCPCVRRPISRYEEFVPADDPVLGAIHHIRADARLALVRDSEATEGALADLWKAARPEAAAGPVAFAGEQWKALGFQSGDPLSDVRGSNQIGLMLLRRVAQSSDAARAAMLRSGEERGYPYAATALNVSHMLLLHLRLVNAHKTLCPCCGVRLMTEAPQEAAMAGFVRLLRADADALFGLYAATMRTLDRDYWSRVGRDASFTLMDFRDVYRFACDGAMAVLARGPPSVHALSAGLAELHSADARAR